MPALRYKTFSNILATALLMALCAAAVGSFVIGTLFFAIKGIDVDWGFDLQVARNITRGMTLYRDGFGGYYGPYVFGLHAFWHKMFGPDLMLARIPYLVHFGWSIAMMLIVFRNLDISFRYALAGVLLYICAVVVWGGTHLVREPYLVTFALTGLALVSRRSFNTSPLVWFGAGLAVGLTLFIKQNAVLYCAAFLVWFLLTAKHRRVQKILYVLAGACTPWIFLFALTPIRIEDWFYSNFILLFRYAEGQKQSWTREERVIFWATELYRHPWILVGTLTCIVDLLYLLRRRVFRELSPQESFRFLTGAIYLASLPTLAVSLFYHYYVAAVPFLVVYIVLFMRDEVLCESGPFIRRTIKICIALLLTLPTVSGGLRYLKYPLGYWPDAIRDTIVEQQAAERVLRFVPRGSHRVWIILNPLINYLSDTDNPLHNSLVANRLSNLKAHLDQIDVIVLSKLNGESIAVALAELAGTGFEIVYDPRGDATTPEPYPVAKFVRDRITGELEQFDPNTVILARTQRMVR